MIHFTRRNLDNYLYVFAFISIAITLNACGFQLRGSINLSEDISPIYMEQNNVFDLAREIKSLLATNKIKVVEDVKQSKAQLTLLSEEKSRRVLSVDGSGRAREYLLIYKVNFVIKTKQPETSAIETIEAKNSEGSIFHDSISVSRSLLFDPDAVLAATNEAEVLYRYMRRETARLILLKLQARSINPSGVRDKPVSDPALDKAKSL